MNWVDAVIIAFLLLIAFIGSKIGVMRAASVCASFVLATAIGARTSIVFASYITKYTNDKELGHLISFAIGFIIAFVILNLIGNAICKAVRATPLAWVDSWIGSALGFISGIILAGLAIMYLTSYPISNSVIWLDGSFLVSVIEEILNPIFQGILKRGYEAMNVAHIQGIYMYLPL